MCHFQFELESEDVKSQNYLPYVKGTKDNFFDIKNSVNWNPKEIILKETDSNITEFKGYTESTGVLFARSTNQQGRGYLEMTINGLLDNIELRLRNVDEYSNNYTKLTTFVSDDNLEQGTFISNKFSSAGTIENNVKALVDCINNYAVNNDNFALSATRLGDKVIISSRIQNDFANSYEWLIYSDDNNEPPITLYFNDLDYISIQEYMNML